MLKDFLYIYELIKVVINTSKSKAFKNKSLILTFKEIIYLNNILNNIFIFIKAITKLQAENYLIIYYIIPEVYKIYNKLESFKDSFKVSIFKNLNKLIKNIILIFLIGSGLYRRY